MKVPSRYKTDVRKMKDSGGGVDPDAHRKLIESGKLKQYASLEEMHQARAKRGLKPETTPAYLLPDDHFRKRKRYTITLSPSAHTLAGRIGKRLTGRTNVSGGIEYALNHYFECPRTDRRRKKE